jgi:hypothetical protein
MNYNRNKGTLIAVIRLPQKGVYGKHNRRRTISHENFFSSSDLFFIDFLPFPYYLLFGNETTKTITQKVKR